MEGQFAFLKERRKYRRLHKPFGVNIVSVGKKKTLPKLNHEVGLNISLGGILVKCAKLIKKNTVIGLKLMLVKDGVYRTLEARGRIAWHKLSFERPTTYFMGIEFKRLSHKDKQKILWYFR